MSENEARHLMAQRRRNLTSQIVRAKQQMRALNTQCERWERELDEIEQGERILEGY